MPDDVLLRATGVSKKFCRSLKRSLWYGVKDIAADLNPLAARRRTDGERRPDNATLRSGEFWALDDVGFELRRGECLGLIGANGAGKTTLLKLLNGLIRPDHGQIEMRGRVGALIALGAGFNPILTGRENIYVNGSVLGLSKREIDAKVDEIIEFAELRGFIDTPVQSYSSGMQVRLGFAVATALEPDILLLDEVLAVGDVAFRAKCFQRIGSILDRSAVIFVSHDAVQISRICDYCMYLKDGRLVALGPTDDIQRRYQLDQPVVDTIPSVVLDESIASFTCSPAQVDVRWGDTFDVVLRMESRPAQGVGLALLALLDGDLSVAQADVTDQVNGGVKAGSPISLRFGPVNLREGTYGLAVTILNETRKGTLVHGINTMSVRVSGPRGYGVPYQVPVAHVAR